MRVAESEPPGVAVHVGLQAKPEPEYTWCFPKDLLHRIAMDALLGTRELKAEILDRSNTSSITAQLNVAWEKFWSDPISFASWERQHVELLFRDSAALRVS